jgi:hypothetical protein
MSVNTLIDPAKPTLCDRVQTSTPSDQVLIANLLDTSPQFKNVLATALQESKHQRNLAQYWQSIMDVALAASHASNVTTKSHRSSLEQTIAALTSPELLAELAPIDPLASARLRGMKVKQELLYSDGKPLRSEEVAQLLGISRQAVDKRRNKGKILAVSLGRRGYFYPLWQFRDGAVLTGLDRILLALAKFDGWTQLMFMKTGDLRLNDRTPLECLVSGDIDAVVNAAACYGEPYPG